MTAIFDVIIVGGRPAGASLAARLGACGVSVLIVDKATFPSAPEVPSCPMLYPRAMLLLDEIGLTEDRYAHASTPVHDVALVFEPHFRTRLRVPRMFGRDYLRGFDRAGFDAALWDHLGRFASVTRRAGFRVEDVLRDPQGRVVGIVGGREGEASEALRARVCVVGADGRHSLIARKVQARVIEDCSERTSTVHFAEWEGLAGDEDAAEPTFQIVTRARGTNVLFFPSARGRVHIATHVRSDRADTGGDAQEFYLRQLRSFAAVRERLVGARQTSGLLGVRKIANRTREAGGAGWVLVGDAVHHKDPVDGQGVYDALIQARRLAPLLLSARSGALAWERLVPAYARAVAEETGPMFRATMQRLARELYEEPPEVVLRTVMRWTICDPLYHRRFFAFLGRECAPEGWLSPGLVARTAARGLLADLRGLLSR